MTDNSDKILRSLSRLDYRRLHNTGESTVKEGSESDCFRSVSSSPAHSSGEVDSAPEVSIDDTDLDNVLADDPFIDEDILDITSKLSSIKVRSSSSSQTTDSANSSNSLSKTLVLTDLSTGSSLLEPAISVASLSETGDPTISLTSLLGSVESAIPETESVAMEK